MMTLKKISPFDWIKSINEKTEMDTTQMAEYSPYIVNRGLSFFEDTILWANEANKLHQLDKDLQYMFLYGVVSKRKRYSKWIKKEDSLDLQPIIEFYKVSEIRAAEIFRLLNNSEIEMIKEKLSKGGR